MRENMENKKLKLMAEEKQKKEDIEMQLKYSDQLEKINKESLMALRATKRKAEDRTNSIIDRIIKEKKKRLEEEEKLQEKYLRIQNEKQQTQEDQRQQKYQAHKKEVLKALESQVNEKRKAKEIEKAEVSVVATQAKQRADEYANQVVEQKLAEKQKFMKHKAELQKQIESNKDRNSFLAGMSQDEFRMNKNKLERAERVGLSPY